NKTSVTKIKIGTKNLDTKSQRELAEKCLDRDCQESVEHRRTAPHPTALTPSTHRPRDHLLHVASRRVASGQEWNKVPPGEMVRPRDDAKGTQRVKGAGGGGGETVYEGMKDED
ncbi:hypothetical protein ALC57_10417, partial [Trachymyrmex cornetzi]